MKSIKFLALVSCLCTFMSCTEKVEEKKPEKKEEMKESE